MSRSLFSFRKKRVAAPSSLLSAESTTSAFPTGSFNVSTQVSRSSSALPGRSSCLAKPPLSAEEGTTTDGRFGIRTISNPVHANLDIWFVHGLTGGRESTWTHSNGTFTPILISTRYPNARVITYGYDANIVGLWKNASGEGLRGHGNTLAYAISNSRSMLEEAERPIIFIAHSLGGLVTEQALLISLEPHEPRLHSIATSTVGIVFMGTPHSGSHLATWGSTLAKVLDRFWTVNESLVSALKQRSEVLRGVEASFQRHLTSTGDLNHIKVFCFYETVPMGVVGFVVPPESAVLLAYPSCGIDSNHRDMTKFTGLRDAGFINIHGVLDDWIRQTVDLGHVNYAKDIPSIARPASDDAIGSVIYQQADQRKPLPSTTVPFRRDDDFVHRDSLKEVHRMCGRSAARAALVGLGGVGKSQIAIEYTYQVRDSSPTRWIFWVHAGSQARFEEGYRRIAEATKMDGWNNPKVDVLRLVRTWLCDESNGEWTMVVDNADDLEVFFSPFNQLQSITVPTLDQPEKLLSDFLPQSPNGSILFTSRSQDVAYRLTGDQCSIIKVKPMNEDDALVLFQRRLQYSNDADVTESVQLVRALDCMPLAISQAAAYIDQRAPRMTATRYLNEFLNSDHKQARLLTKDVGDNRRDGRASNSILTTWQISFDYLCKELPSAARLLSLMCLFDRQGIPESLLRDEYQVEKDEDEFEDDIHILRSYSLISTDNTGSVFEMHRLVQFSTKKWLELHSELEKWKEVYAKLIDKIYPVGRHENWKVCQELFPHAQAALGNRPANTKALEAWASVLFKAAWYAREMGRYEIAKHMDQNALEARQSTLGAEHPTTLESLSNLAMVIHYQGKFTEAERMHQEVLGIRERTLGRLHPDTLTSQNNLAYVLHHQGNFAEGERIFKLALDGREKILGEQDPETLDSLSHLALLLRDQGKLKEAENMMRRALERKHEVLGKSHPDTLSSQNDLVLTLQDQGRYAEAGLMNQEVLAGRETTLGKHHPDTLVSLSHQASILDYLGRYTESEPIKRQVLVARERSLGKDHPDTVASLNNVASSHSQAGRYKEAESILKQVVDESTRTVGESHMFTLTQKDHLASVFWRQGNYEEAEKLCRQVIEARARTLGGEHHDTLLSQFGLAQILGNLGRSDESKQLHEFVLRKRTQTLGEGHPDTLHSLETQAEILWREGKLEESERLNRKVHEQKEKVLGADNPYTTATLNNLALVLLDQGKHEDAERIAKLVLAGREKTIGAQHPGTLLSLYNLAQILHSREKNFEARETSERALEGHIKVLGPDHPSTRACLEQLEHLKKVMKGEAVAFDE